MTDLAVPPRGGEGDGRELRVVDPEPVDPDPIEERRAMLRRGLRRMRTIATLLLLLMAAIFVAIAASTVAVPILASAAAGHRLDDPMARLKGWMEKNNAALLAAILVLIGLMVLYNGASALF